ncbi:MAG: TolC family protein [Chlamydiota bacterium]
MKLQSTLKTFIFLLSLTVSLQNISAQLDEEEYNIEELKTKTNPCGINKPLTLTEAVAYTLENQMGIKIAIEEVDRQKGVVQEISGAFDPVTAATLQNTNIANSQSPTFATKLSGNITEATISESKLFRSGTNVSIQTGINQVKDPGNFLFPYNEGNLTVGLNQPLMRGFLYGPFTTAELAGKVAYKASYYDALHTISERLLDTIINYWNVVSSQKVVEIRKQTVEAFQDLYEKTLRLVEEDQLAKSEINQPLANLATAQVDYTASLQQLYRDMQLLRLSLGIIPTQCVSKNTYEAVEDFPEIFENVDICQYMNGLICSAYRYRNDIIASRFRETEFKYLLRGAGNDLLPELDLIAEYNLTNYKRGPPSRKFFSGGDIGNPDRRATAGVSFSMPFCNNEAKGRYRRISADLKRAEFETVELQQTVTADVMRLALNHYHIIQEVKEAKKAVLRFEELVVDEGKRLNEGIGSLFNLIDYENNLTSSRETLVLLERDYAENLSRLHFSSGSLLSPDTNLCWVDVGDIRKLPDTEDGNY